jgi:hypothetical protein
MTTFQDGPAKDQALMLKRCACFLRVTIEGKTCDALDQPFDEPKAGEKLYAYELVELRGNAMVNFGGGRGGCYPIAYYRLAPVQPTDEQMRKTKTWQTWCAQQPAYVRIPTDVPLY